MGSAQQQGSVEPGLEVTPILYVNGKRHVLPQGAGEVTLLNYLRRGRAAAAAACRLLPPVLPAAPIPAHGSADCSSAVRLYTPALFCSIPATDLGLTGAKLGCGEGGCGACTVLVSSVDQGTGALHHRSINACLCPLYAVRVLRCALLCCAVLR